MALKSDNGITFSIPSVEQKREWAKGKSFEMANTRVSFILDASWLNLRTLVAHTPVSKLGKIFSTNVLPLKSSNVIVARSDFTRVNAGAFLPVSGRLPFNDTGCFLKFTFFDFFYFF